MRGEGARSDHAGGFFFHRGGISAERLATSMLRYTLACMTVATATAQMISNSTFDLRAYILGPPFCVAGLVSQNGNRKI